MSTVKTNNVQIGQSVTATNNFTLYQPATPDGTVRLGNGNSGSVTDLVTLTSAGNLGIGTSSPTSIANYNALTLGGSSTKGLLTLRSSSGSDSGYLYHTGSSIELAALSTTPLNITTSNANLTLGTVGTTRVTLDQSGNLGLGVTPSAWYSLYKAYQFGIGGSLIGRSDNAGIELTSNSYRNSAGNYIYLNTDYSSSYRQYAGQHQWWNAPSGTAGNAISFTQAMTLDASGNLLVGTTSTTLTNGGAYIAPGSATLLDMGHASGSASGNYYALFRYAGTLIGSITQNGTTGVLYNITSDQRLKENIVDAPSALPSINAIKVRSFDWKSDGSHSEYGYIAQELLEVAPEAVHVPTDPEEMMGVDFGKLTPRLVKAIQELSAELNLLKQKVNA